MKLLIQPGDGVDRVVKGIRKAKKSVEIVIFRFDRSEIERALTDAVGRGVSVRALIAFTNRGGEEHLRKLEMRLLESGISVARTAGDLVRYHGKMMLVDRKDLYLLAFNFTHLDIDHSRTFGLITRNPELLHEAEKLFEADTKRQPYAAGSPKFVVSPVNARKALASFIKGAKKELLIYDPEVSDREMLRTLQDRRKAGVEVRVIGKVSRNQLQSRTLTALRLHTRTIVRDRQQAFMGSQSLRHLELDSRREIGIIFRNRSIVQTLARTFEEDWAASEPAERERGARDLPLGKTARKMAKVVGKNLPVAPVVKQVAKAIQKKGDLALRPKVVEETVKTAVTEAVKDAVKDATKEAIQGMITDAELTEADAK
ncbi:MAG TPA: phospholipase D-like domain-containing protein [Candidatus Polarisedimenticolia bacterium]|nr:phospholipase D-like domain-containing protein [Candidatus Polarisedimenticolia bacterium]